MSKLPRSTMILTPLPSGGKMHHEVHQLLSHARMVYASLGVNFMDQAFAGMDQPQCRAELLAFYYRNREHFEDLIWLDSDTVVAPEVFTLLGTLEEPVLCIPYEQRRRDEQKYQAGALEHWAVATDGKQSNVTVREGRRMLPVRGTGLGCTRIRRHVVEQLWRHEFPEGLRAPKWTSAFPGLEGTEVCGLFEPIVHEHIPGSGILRRRPEDLSFFTRTCAAGWQPYALADVAIWHDGKGGVSLWDALVNQERERSRMRRRVDFELVDCPDNLIGLHEVLDGAYDIVGLELAPGETILDIGANIGAFAVWASARFPGCNIRCYEPVPENCSRLLRNTEKLDGVTLDARAVVGDSRIANVRIAPGRCNDGEWSTHDDAGVAHDWDRAIEVPAIAARKLPPAAVLKLDCEGSEREILEAYPHLEGVKAIMLEWHSVEDYRWIMQFMAEQAFVPMVDRARGRPMPDRELCFLRAGAFLGKVAEGRASNGVSVPGVLEEASP